MFSNMTHDAINLIYNFLSKDADVTMNMLLDLSAEKILDLIRKNRMTGAVAKLKVDEDDIFNDAMVYYKDICFDPTKPLRVSINDQPAVDTGGIRRQFFTDLLDYFSDKDTHSIFIGDRHRLRPHHSPQLLPLIKILGIIIAHSLVQGGPGFPYFAPYIYWYLVSGSEETSLSYVTAADLTPSVADLVQRVSTRSVSID